MTQSTQALNQAAKAQIEQGQYDDARATLQSSLAQEKTPVAFRYLGVICRFQKQLPAALQWFEEALKLDPEDPATLSQVAETYFDGGDLTQATAFYAFAITRDPENLRYMERFVAMSQRVTFVNHSEVVEKAIIACLEHPELNAYPLQALWFNTFLLSPAYQPLYSPAAERAPSLLGKLFKSDAPAAAVFPPEANLKPLITPFFLLGLQQLTVFSLDFENFLKRLRRTLLETGEKEANGLTTPEATLLAGALSHYCYNNEYIFHPTAEEVALVAALRQRLSAGSLDAAALPVAIYACYERLASLPNARQLGEALGNHQLIDDVIKTQVSDPLELQEIRKSIPAITEIDNEISVRVREQYEESPYPMWTRLPKGLHIERPAQRLQGRPANILVAGCGTGHESLQYAVLFPQAEVLAIDLSLSSMAYAVRKAREFGINNISFRQADILKLGSLGRQFDCVVSGGVLHHMQDMFRGWEVLTGLIAPNGVMKIGLYSKIARRHLMAAHQIIRKNYPSLDLMGMREFRSNSEKTLGKDLTASLSRFEDYHHLSMYRDMMFHVQERNLDLTEIQGMLDRLGLEFLEFSLPKEVKARFAAAFPADPDGKSLANWHEFEKNNPDTFSACYIFWCQKKDKGT